MSQLCIFVVNPPLGGFFVYIENVENMSKVSYYTEEGLKKLRAELNQLKDIERPKDDFYNLKLLAKMENILSNARIINESELDTSKVLIHSIVELKNRSNGALMTYTLVAQSEADLKTGKISVNSPIGMGLLGKKVGEFAEIIIPNGSISLEIISISRS